MAAQLVDELLVECVHRTAGCAAVTQRQGLAAHLRDGCAYAQARCDEAGCVAEVRRGELEAHRRDAHGEREEEEKEDEGDEVRGLCG